MTRKVVFTINDGTEVTLDCEPRFEDLVKEKLGMPVDAHVTDADVKRVFVEALRSASRLP